METNQNTGIKIPTVVKDGKTTYRFAGGLRVDVDWKDLRGFLKKNGRVINAIDLNDFSAKEFDRWLLEVHHSSVEALLPALETA